MRKWLALTLVLTLMAALPLTARAVDGKLGSVAIVAQLDTSAPDAVAGVTAMAVLVQTADGDVWITPAAAVPALPSGEPLLSTYLMTEDGKIAWVASVKPLGESGISVLTCEGQLEPLSVPVAAVPGSMESQALVGYLDNGTLVSSGAENITFCLLDDGSIGMTLTAMDGLKPGSATYDRDGRLTGVILSSLGEGEGRYLAISALSLNAVLNGAPAPAQTGPEPNELPSAEELLNCSFDGGYLMITPAGVTAPAEQDLSVYYMDAGNAYYTWLTHEAGAKDIEFVLPAVPGRRLMVWYAAGGTEHGAEEFETLLQTQDPLVVELPEAKVLDRNEYRQECYLASERLGKVVGVTERLEPAAGITRERLVDPGYKAYLQVNSQYTVDKNSEESLLVCLYTPDGSCLADVAAFIWGVEYMAEDDWHEDVTELFSYYAEINGGVLPEGEYTLSYYIGEELAGSYSFTLTDSAMTDGGGEV